MTEKEQQIAEEMIDLIDRIKVSTNVLNTVERIPQSELDGIVSRIEKLYKKAVVLKYLHSHLDEIVVKQVEKEMKQNIQHSVEAETTISPTDPEVDSSTPENDTEEAGAAHDDTSPITTDSGPSLAEKLQREENQNLKAQIGVNDRYMYVQELFKGQDEVFNQAIHDFNNMSSMEEADTYIQANYEWDPESEAVASFFALLERRYQ